MKKITLKDLRAIEPYTTIESGLTDTFGSLKWVAQKLPNHYWTAYVGLPEWTDKEITNRILHLSKETINFYFYCDKAVLKRYKG